MTWFSKHKDKYLLFNHIKIFKNDTVYILMAAEGMKHCKNTTYTFDNERLLAH